MKAWATIGCMAALSILAFAQPCHADGAIEFRVKDIFEEETFTLSEARGNYVLVHFLLDSQCPVCARHVENYIREASSFPLTKQIFLKGGEPKDILAWTSELNVIVPPISRVLVYRDPEATVAESLGVPVEDGHLKFPATILIDPQGQEIFRYIGISKWDHYAVESFRDRMAELDYDPIIRKYNLERPKIAVQGYDVVDYVERDSARKGTSYFAARYQGANYHFASETNRVRFAADPDKYLPAYGGWCATDMAEGELADIDPTLFKVTNGRLFLFQSDNGRARRDAWVADEAALTGRADVEWNALLSR